MLKFLLVVIGTTTSVPTEIFSYAIILVITFSYTPPLGQKFFPAINSQNNHAGGTV
jgi:hypothetical protein